MSGLHRLVPVLLLDGSRLVKTRQFADPRYIGDPRNAVRIFNEKSVDELMVLDISASRDSREPNWSLLSEIVSEAFMPVAYGGGLRSLEQAERIVSLGIEKVVIGTKAVEDPGFVSSLAKHLGRQSVVVCIDVLRGADGQQWVYSHGGSRRSKFRAVEFAKTMEDCGAGELTVQAIHRDGMMAGYDVSMVREVTDSVHVPVIALGGAGSLLDCVEVVRDGFASAAAAGSYFVYFGPRNAVLISYPRATVVAAAFAGIDVSRTAPGNL